MYRTIICVMLVILFWCSFEHFTNNTTSYMITSLLNGDAHAFSDYQESILQTIKDGDDEVTIYYDSEKFPRRDPIIIGLELENINGEYGVAWRNAAVARFYGKKAVYMID